MLTSVATEFIADPALADLPQPVSAMTLRDALWIVQRLTPKEVRALAFDRTADPMLHAVCRWHQEQPSELSTLFRIVGIHRDECGSGQRGPRDLCIPTRLTEILQDHAPHTINELMDRFDCTASTVRGAVRKLRALKLPICGEPTQGGYAYRLLR